MSIVVPYRVQGFGPDEGVLSELDYRADKRGLLPHPNVPKCNLCDPFENVGIPQTSRKAIICCDGARIPCDR